MTILQIISQYENRVTRLIDPNSNIDTDELVDGSLVRQFLEDVSNASDRQAFCGPELTDFVDSAPNLRWHILLETMRNA